MVERRHWRCRWRQPTWHVRPCPGRAWALLTIDRGHMGAAAFLEELRDYSMKLHTRSQAPKEGRAPEKKEQKPVSMA